MKNWKTWLWRLLPIVGLIFAVVAYKEHSVAQIPGAYGAPDIGGEPITAIGAALASLVAMLAPIVKDWRSGTSASVATEQSHLAGLASLYVSEPDSKALDFLRDLAVHRKGAPSTATTPAKPEE